MLIWFQATQFFGIKQSLKMGRETLVNKTAISTNIYPVLRNKTGNSSFWFLQVKRKNAQTGSSNFSPLAVVLGGLGLGAKV